MLWKVLEEGIQAQGWLRQDCPQQCLQQSQQLLEGVDPHFVAAFPLQLAFAVQQQLLSQPKQGALSGVSVPL